VPSYSIPRNKQDSSSTSGGLRMTFKYHVTLNGEKGLSHAGRCNAYWCSEVLV